LVSQAGEQVSLLTHQTNYCTEIALKKLDFTQVQQSQALRPTFADSISLAIILVVVFSKLLA
jgi:hypothetical protein